MKKKKILEFYLDNKTTIDTSNGKLRLFLQVLELQLEV